MTTPNLPNDNSDEQPLNPGDIKFDPDTVLTPEKMLELASGLLSGFEAKFPDVGVIPAEVSAESSGFVSGKSAKKIYTPGKGERPLIDKSDRSVEGVTPVKDFAPFFVQCFGKTVTMRLRGPQTLTDEEQLHKKVPKIIRRMLSSQNEDEKIDLMDQLSKVVAHNMERELNDELTVRAISAHIWMINKLSAIIAPAEATE